MSGAVKSDFRARAFIDIRESALALAYGDPFYSAQVNEAPMLEASKRLIEAALAEEIIVYGKQSYQFEPTKHEPIKATDWLSLQIEEIALFDPDPAARKKHGSVNYGGIDVERLVELQCPLSEVVALYNKINGIVNPIEGQPLINKGGRPPKYDWEAFYVELVVRAENGNLPDKQTDAVEEMSQWFIDNYDESPVESLLKRKLSPIYQHPEKIHIPDK